MAKKEASIPAGVWVILLPLQLRTHHIGQAPGPDGGSQDLPAEYHFKQQLLIQVARHVNCNKKQHLKKLEGKDAGWSCTEHNRRDEE